MYHAILIVFHVQVLNVMNVNLNIISIQLNVLLAQQIVMFAQLIHVVNVPLVTILMVNHV